MMELKEVLEKMKGEYVNIYTRHRLFGTQHIRMRFDPEIELGYGFRCKGQSIYIRENELVDYLIIDNRVIIIGENIEINIKVAS